METCQTQKESSIARQRLQAMLDASPILCQIFVNGKIVEVNEAAVSIFGLPNKQVYIDRFYDFSPKYQADGTLTRDKVAQSYQMAVETGRAQIIWTHQASDGTPIPCEVFLERVLLGDETAVIAYSRDMRESEEFSEIFLRFAPFGVIMLDDNFDFIRANKHAIDIFEASGAKKTLDDMIPEFQPCGTRSMDKFYEYYKKAKEEKTHWFEFEWRTENGNPLPSETVFAIAKRYGRDILLIYVNDLSLVNAAIERELEAESRANLLLETAPVSIVLFDKNMNPIDCNESAAKMLGFPDKEEYLKKYYNLIPSAQFDGDDSKKMAAHYFYTALNEGYSFMPELICRKSDGTLFPVETTYMRTRYKNDFAVIEYRRDITEIVSERKREHERELDERIRVMFDAAPLLIEYWDNDYNAIDCNQTVLEYFGFLDKAEYFDYLDESNNVKYDGEYLREMWNTHIQEIFDKGHGSFDYMDKKPTGEFTSIEVHGVRSKIEGKTVVLTYSNDVSALREAQKEQQRIEIAEEASRAKTRFLARMSHEIRTPITAVLGISEIQLRNPDMPDYIAAAFAKVYDSSTLLLKIVNDILDFSKIETGNMSIVTEEYEVSSLVSDAAQLHIVYLEHKNITFNMQVDENLPAVLIGDELRIRQIITNLLSNSFKYTVSGRVDLSLQREDTEDACVTLMITVKDTGLGMTAKQLELLRNNDDYTRFHEHENPTIGGTGLGLPIVSNLLKMMGGRIDIESEAGKGTCVVVRIPQETSGIEILGKEAVDSLLKFDSKKWSKSIKFVPEPMPYGNVLVVDDVEANLYVAQGLLSFYGLKIDTCDNGYSAIDLIKQGNEYDIIFLDHMMPGISGTETMKEMRKMSYTGSIVALTANALIGQAEEFIEKGFDDFVSKPIQTMCLNEVLNKFVRDKQPPEVLASVKDLHFKTGADSELNHYSIEDFLIKSDVKLYIDFAKRDKNTMHDIRSALSSNDIEKAHRIMHNLKGMAGLIKEESLLNVAQEAEDSLREGRIPSEEQLHCLESELIQVLEKSEHMKRRDLRQPKNIAENNIADFELNHCNEKAIDLLDELEPLLKDKNADALDLLDKLRLIPDSGILIKQIEEFNFEDALRSMYTLKSMV